MKPHKLALILFLFLAIGQGCAGLDFALQPVQFDDPLLKLGITKSDPTPEELAGIELKFFPSETGVLHSNGTLDLFMQIKDGKGQHARMLLSETETYKSGTRPNSYVVKTETNFIRPEGLIVEEAEVTERGEMVRFMKGEHNSKLGHFSITDWKRTSEFPDKPVKPKESWRYSEEMSMKLNSRFIKDLNPKPYQINATSVLTGFAVVKDTRLAVITTRILKSGQEHYKILFQELILDEQENTEEVTYLDYKKGKVVAQVTDTQTFTSGVNVPFADESRARLVLTAE